MMSQATDDELLRELLRGLLEAIAVLAAKEGGARVDVAAAITGTPELPPTPRSTLYRWLAEERTARILGVDHRAARRAQRPLVAGLLQLQASSPRPGSGARSR
jgi:hypothetical protein